MNNKLQTQKKFYDYIQKSIINSKKISHAYLIEVSNLSNYIDIIKEFSKILFSIKYEFDELQKTKISTQIDNNCYPDLKIIQPDGQWIKKEQLIKLEMEFSKKSVLNNKMIYIIDKAENLNDSSANTILKFLEEPQNDIIAILLTSNRYQVLDTIISRCQILSLSTENNIQMTISPDISEFINDINNQKDLIINFDKYMTTLFFDKETSKINLNILSKYFCTCLDENNTNNHKNILDQINNDKILKYINYFNIFEEQLIYNVNLKLWLTNFLIKIMEVR